MTMMTTTTTLLVMVIDQKTEKMKTKTRRMMGTTMGLLVI
jgi:hypothetical protein